MSRVLRLVGQAAADGGSSRAAVKRRRAVRVRVTLTAAAGVTTVRTVTLAARR